MTIDSCTGQKNEYTYQFLGKYDPWGRGLPFESKHQHGA